jgi:hypothetical protein
MAHRPLKVIAAEIDADWTNMGDLPRENVDAMKTLNTLNEMYYADSASSVVSYFLARAQTWKGPVARRVKLELNEMLKAHRAPAKAARKVAAKAPSALTPKK